MAIQNKLYYDIIFSWAVPISILLLIFGIIGIWLLIFEYKTTNGNISYAHPILLTILFLIQSFMIFKNRKRVGNKLDITLGVIFSLISLGIVFDLQRIIDNKQEKWYLYYSLSYTYLLLGNILYIYCTGIMDRESIGERIGDMFNTHLFRDKTKSSILSDKINRRKIRLEKLNNKQLEKNKNRELIQDLSLIKLKKEISADSSISKIYELLNGIKL